MLPFIHDGDMTIFRDNPRPKLDFVNAVKILVDVPPEVYPDGIEEGTTCAKELRWEDGRIGLVSYNPAYPTLHVPFQVFGYLVGLIHDEGSKKIITLDTEGLQLK
jgi:hypothetical protein